MKKALILFSAMLLLVGGAMAKPVGADKARRVAETYLGAKGMKNVTALQNVTAQTPFTEFYVFAAPEGGFILVSADDCVMPVLGYSLTSIFDAKRELPENVRQWFDDYEREIRYWKGRASAASFPMGSMEVESQWSMLTSGQMPPSPLTTAVSPILTTTWDQYPYYNSMCPYDARETFTPDGHVVTGCVATATAQIMKKYNHPTTGYSSHSYVHNNGDVSYGTLSANFGNTTYQWSSMPNALNSTSSTTQVNAVATLMYHIGVADEMIYDLGANGGSGAFNYNYDGTLSASSQTSLMKYFKYRPDMAAIARNDYSYADYTAILRGELDQQRPILYSGKGSGGHSFVCDGYDNDGDFHINWGWSGYYDGYFTVDVFTPGGGGAGSSSDHNYSKSNVALIGIRPNTSWSTSGTTTVNVSATGGDINCSTYGTGSYSFGDTIQLEAYAPDGYRFYKWNDGDRFNPREMLATGGSYNFTAVFEPLQGDTLGYCTEYCHNITRYGTSTWGIRLPASVLTAGRDLNAAMLYVGEEGTYTLQVYLGNNLTTPVASSQAFVFDEEDVDQWYTFPLTMPVQVDGTQDVVLSFTCSDASYPATVTSWCGNANGFLYGSSLTPYSSNYTFMIRGIFGEHEVPQVDNNCVIQYFPYTQDFDGTSVLCWSVSDQNQDGTSWSWYGSVGNNGSSCLGVNTESGANDITIAPLIVTPGSYVVNWKAATYWEPDHNETYKVVALTGSGIDTLFSETLSSSTFVDRSATFTVAQGDTVRIGFWATSVSGDYFLIDNIIIDTASQQTVVSTFPWTEGFNDTVLPVDFAFVDGDNDGHNWTMSRKLGNLHVHEGLGCITSASYDHITYDPLSPNNWMILPGFALPATATDFTLSWWVRGQDEGNFAAEYYSVYVTTAGSNISNFTATTPVYAGYSTSEYVKQTVNLGSYAGQTIYVAFRHHNVTDMYFLNIDEMRVGPLEAPEVSVSGPEAVAMGNVATYTATAPTATSFSWYVDEVLQAGSSNVFTTTFTTAGNHTVKVGATNAGGTNYDNVVTLAYDAANAVARHTLIEEFTTAPTVFAPDATRRIQNAIAGQENNVVWVTHHVGYNPDDLTLTESNQLLELYGNLGTWAPAMAIDRSVEYVEDVNPSGVVGSVSLSNTIAANLTDALAAPSFVSVNLSNINFNASTRQLTFTASGNVNEFNGTQLRLSVYLIEDSIVSTQDSIDATLPNYVHNHVIRAAISNIWGDADAFTGTTGAYSKNYTYTLPATFNAAHCRVVAFVNDYGVDALHRKVLNATQSEYLSDSPVSQTYTITALSADATMGTVTGGGTYQEGTVVTLTAIPNSGYHFVQWNDGVTQNPRTVTVTANATYTATFEANSTPGNCDVTTLPWNYSFINDGISDCWTNLDADGDSLKWTYYQNYGAVSFSYVEYNGNGYSLTPDNWLISPKVTLPAGGADFHYTYMNVAPNYPDHIGVFVSTTNSNPSSFTLLESYTAVAADTVWHTRTVSLAAYAGQQVYLAIRHYNSDDKYAFVVGSVSVTATGVPQQQYTITALSADNTMGTVTGGGLYNEGAVATLTAIPNSGYQFSSWQDGNTQNPRSITVTGNATYTATFEEEVINDCVVDVPYFTDFDDDVECWDVYDPDQDATSTGLNRWYLFEQVGVNGTDAFGIANTNSNFQGDYLISPMVTGAGTYVVTWKARTYSPATLYYVVFASGVDTVGTLDSIADTNFNLRSYTFTLDEDDTVSVVFDYINIGGSYLIIDDFSITRNGTPEPTQYTVTAVSNNEVWGTVTGGGTYAEGATVTLTATANPGCHFVQWNDGDTNAVRTFTATANVTLVAYFAVDEVTTYTVTVTSNNPVWGTVTGGGEYEEGSQAILTATAYPGCRFLRWNDYDTNAVRTVSVTSNLTFVAIFDTIVIPHYTLTVSSNNPAWGTVTGGGSYEEGTTATLIATANPGCRFLRWHDNDTNATRTVSVTANATYVAIFDTIVIPRHTITVLSNNPAWGTVTGSGEYEEGTVVTLTATANSGYHFVMWNDGDTNAVRTVTVTATAVYTATFAQNGTEVTFYTVSVLCNDASMGVVSGSGSYAENTTAVLTATAYPGYHFVEWNDGDTNVVRSVTVTGDVTYIATFAANAVVTYTLTVLSNNNAWGTVTGSGTYNEGSTAILTATPNPGYHFVEWNDGDTNAVRTVNVTATATYIATFEVDAVVTYTLTVLSSNNAWGTVTGSGTYNEGSTAILTATANPGYHFVEWNDGDTNAVHTVNVTADATYIATFEADAVVTYTLTVLSNNNAWGTVTGSGIYNEGSTAILTATPTVGYRFVQWNDGDTNAVRMVTVTADTSFIATFEAIPAPHYTITVLSSNENKGTVTGSGSYEEGSQVTITATPNQGYRFVQWNDGDTNAIRTITVTANATYIATFDDQVGIEEVSAMDVKLYPNPATDYVVVEGVAAQAQLSLVDAAGRACGTWTATGERTTLDISHLSSGHYFLRIVQNGTESVKKIVVE